MSKVIGYSVEDFYRYCEQLADQGISFDSVEEYIECWLSEGYAARHCAYQFQIFLAAIALIYAQHHDRHARCKGEADWHWTFPWRVTQALKCEEEVNLEIFNPLRFQYFCTQD